MKNLFFISILLISSLAQAWTLVSTGVDGDQFFSDINTIQRKANIVRVWEKTEYSTNGETESRSVRIYREYDCEEKKLRNLSLEAFSGTNLTGKNIAQSSKPSDWSFIPPNTVASARLNFACNRR